LPTAPLLVEFSTTMALLVLMQRCNFVSAGTESIDYRSNETFYCTDNLARGSAFISERRGLVVKKLDCQIYNWRFEANRSPA